MQNQVERKHIIKLESSFKIEGLPKAKLQQNYDNGTVAKSEVLKCNGSSFKGVLYTIRKFCDACHTLNFDTGLEQFNNFKLCLYSYAKDEWLLIQGVPLALAQFNLCLRDFVLGFMSSDTKQILDNYPLDLKKPRASIDVHTYASRFQMINRYIRLHVSNQQCRDHANPTRHDSQQVHVFLMLLSLKKQKERVQPAMYRRFCWKRLINEATVSMKRSDDPMMCLNATVSCVNEKIKGQCSVSKGMTKRQH
jgi:hypothetical protein